MYACVYIYSFEVYLYLYTADFVDSRFLYGGTKSSRLFTRFIFMCELDRMSNREVYGEMTVWNV